MKIIDSSTIVKYFSAEPGWGDLREYLNVPVTIELSIQELGNALWKKVSSNQFDLNSASEILIEFQRITKFYDQRKYVKRACEISVNHHITIYDSLFIAAALVENCELITSDTNQGRISAENGVKTIVV